MQQLLETAKTKASNLTPGTQIRVVPDKEINYWVFNMGGTLFIGSLTEAPMKKFFRNRQEYVMSDKNGVQRGLLQRLF